MPGPELPYINLNKRAFEKVHITEQAAEEEVAALLPDAVAAQNPVPLPTLKAGQPDRRSPLSTAFLPHRNLAAPTPACRWPTVSFHKPNSGRELAHSYAYHGNWFVMLAPWRLSDGGHSPWGGTTHFSPWSYDRHVPSPSRHPFVPGEYHERVAPVDLATTFASRPGVNFPSAAVGRVLTEALKPEHAKQ